MITLPTTKRWTGDEFGSSCARIFTLIKRNDKVALYKRVVESTGTLEAYEVFHIKMKVKGQPLPGGLFEQEDREVYPSVGSFGKTAWMPNKLAVAEQMFDELTKMEFDKIANEDEIEHPSVNHSLLFSTQEYATKNGLDYAIAYLRIKAEVESGKIKYVMSERRNTRGKSTKLFTMTS